MEDRFGDLVPFGVEHLMALLLPCIGPSYNFVHSRIHYQSKSALLGSRVAILDVAPEVVMVHSDIHDGARQRLQPGHEGRNTRISNHDCVL